MEDKHTPGPWTFKAIASCGNDQPCRWEILGAGGVVAETNNNTSDADAKLIAAAPAMLEALRYIATLDTSQDASPAQCSAVLVAMEVIDKATK